MLGRLAGCCKAGWLAVGSSAMFSLDLVTTYPLYRDQVSVRGKKYIDNSDKFVISTHNLCDTNHQQVKTSSITSSSSLGSVPLRDIQFNIIILLSAHHLGWLLLGRLAGCC